MKLKPLTMALGLTLLAITPAFATPEQDAYQAGHLAMAQQSWAQAAENFKAATNDKSLEDSATYWQAYVLYQSKQKGRARVLLRKLLREYPQSQWADDAQILLAEHGDLNIPKPPTLPIGPVASVPPVLPEPPILSHAMSVEDDLRLFAIQEIMHQNPEKGAKMAKELLNKNTPVAAKTSAIHLLGISESPEASATLFDFIKNAENTELRAMALQMFSMRNEAQTANKLVSLYHSTSDKNMKRAVIQSFVHQDNANRLKDLLAAENDSELSQQLIHMMGIMGDVQVLKSLYTQLQDLETKSALLESLAMAGESAMIHDVISNEKNPELRKIAIHSLMMSGETDGDYLLSLYRNSRDLGEKQLVATVMMSADMDAEDIKSLYKSETNSELKKALLMSLMTNHSMGDLAALYENEASPEIKEEILHHLGAMGEIELLNQLAKKHPQVTQSEAFYMALGMSGEAGDLAFLKAQYAKADSHIQESILQAFLMSGDAEGLVALYKQTKDKDSKKSILRTIGMIDADLLLELIEAQEQGNDH